MNATSRAILQTALATDPSLSATERGAFQRLSNGQEEPPALLEDEGGGRLLVTQKRAAEMLSVSRVTIWRMTRDCALHPVEILPGTLRYPYRELAQLAQHGARGAVQRGALSAA